MSGISIPLHGDNPYASETHKKEFCSQCNRVQDEWEVYQKPENNGWFKKCTICEGEVCIKDPEIIENLNKEKAEISSKEAEKPKGESK